MKRHAWKQGETKSDGPLIQWKDGEFFVSLPMGQEVIEAKWRPTVRSVVRIREVGAAEWSPGFITPIAGCTFTGLKPHTEYEVSIAYIDDKDDEGPPGTVTFRTDSEGGAEG